MAIKRLRNDIQLEQSSGSGAIMTTNAGHNAIYLENPGADRIAFYDHSTGLLAWLSLGAGLSFNGTTLESSAGSGFISDVQEEGSSVGSGLTTINFVGSGYTVTAAGPVASVTLDSDLNALADLATTGIATRTGAGTWATRTLTGTAGRLSISNGTGVSGNPTFDIDSNVAFKNANETITASWTFNNNIVAASVPTLGDHLVNKTYVDGLLAGVRRSSARVATLVAGTLATSFENGDTVDGVTLATGDRILIKNQAAPAENGLYIVQASGAPVRATDMDAAGEVDGTLVIIEDGTQQGQQWYTVSEVAVLNTDPIVFTKIAVGTLDGSGAANRVAFWSDSDTLDSNANFIFTTTTGSQLVIGDTSAAASTILTTKGTTDDNNAFGYIHKGANGTVNFRVANDGSFRVGASNYLFVDPSLITRADNLTISTTSTGVLALASAAASSSAISLTTSGSGETTMLNSAAAYAGSVVNIGHSANKTYTTGGGSVGILHVAGAYVVASGTGMMSDLVLASTINQTGTSSGITRGLYVKPTLTAAADYRGIEITANSSHYAMYSTAGKWRIDLGTDATGDIFYRNSSNNIARLAIGSSTQVLIGGTTPSWGSAPVNPTECYFTGVTGATVDLDANSGTVKDRDGNNIAFTVPTDGKKMMVFRGGALIDSDGTGGTPSRDYSVNTTTHVITFNEALTPGETVYIIKFP